MAGEDREQQTAADLAAQELSVARKAKLDKLFEKEEGLRQLLENVCREVGYPSIANLLNNDFLKWLNTGFNNWEKKTEAPNTERFLQLLNEHPNLIQYIQQKQYTYQEITIPTTAAEITETQSQKKPETPTVTPPPQAENDAKEKPESLALPVSSPTINPGPMKEQNIEKIAKKNATRRKALTEAINTEQNMVDSLDHLIKKIDEHLKNNSSSTDFTKYLTKIKSYILPIFRAHEMFAIEGNKIIEKMNESQDEKEKHACEEKFNELLKKYLPIFYNADIAYINQYEDLIKEFSELKKRHNSQASNLESALGDKLGSFLITPVQRVMRYELLLKTVKENSNKENFIFTESLALALELAGNVNEGNRDISNREKVLKKQVIKGKAGTKQVVNRRFDAKEPIPKTLNSQELNDSIIKNNPALNGFYFKQGKNKKIHLISPQKEKIFTINLGENALVVNDKKATKEKLFEIAKIMGEVVNTKNSRILHLFPDIQMYREFRAPESAVTLSSSKPAQTISLSNLDSEGISFVTTFIEKHFADSINQSTLHENERISLVKTARKKFSLTDPSKYSLTDSNETILLSITKKKNSFTINISPNLNPQQKERALQLGNLLLNSISKYNASPNNYKTTYALANSLFIKAKSDNKKRASLNEKVSFKAQIKYEGAARKNSMDAASKAMNAIRAKLNKTKEEVTFDKKIKPFKNEELSQYLKVCLEQLSVFTDLKEEVNNNFSIKEKDKESLLDEVDNAFVALYESIIENETNKLQTKDLSMEELYTHLRSFSASLAPDGPKKHPFSKLSDSKIKKISQESSILINSYTEVLRNKQILNNCEKLFEEIKNSSDIDEIRKYYREAIGSIDKITDFNKPISDKSKELRKDLYKALLIKELKNSLNEIREMPQHNVGAEIYQGVGFAKKLLQSDFTLSSSEKDLVNKMQAIEKAHENKEKGLLVTHLIKTKNAHTIIKVDAFQEELSIFKKIEQLKKITAIINQSIPSNNEGTKKLAEQLASEKSKHPLYKKVKQAQELQESINSYTQQHSDEKTALDAELKKYSFTGEDLAMKEAQAIIETAGERTFFSSSRKKKETKLQRQLETLGNHTKTKVKNQEETHKTFQSSQIPKEANELNEAIRLKKISEIKEKLSSKSSPLKRRASLPSLSAPKTDMKPNLQRRNSMPAIKKPPRGTPS